MEELFAKFIYGVIALLLVYSIHWGVKTLTKKDKEP